MSGRYTAYSEYKKSNFEWLGVIPKHWEVVYSKWLFDDRNNKATQSDEMLTASQKYGVIPQKLFMKLEQQKVVQVQKGHDILKQVKENDFVISMRSFQGGIEFCGYDGAVSSAYVPLVPQGDLSLLYFKYLFKSKQYIQALQSTTNLVRDGQALRYSNFLQVKLPLPSKTEANKIGLFLDCETAKIDSLITKQEKLIELLNEKRQAVISYAVTRGLNADVPMKDSGVEWLGNIPKHWGVSKLRFISSFGRGLSITKANLQERGIPCVSYGEVHSKFGFEVDPAKHNLKFVDESYLVSSPASLLSKGDFVFADTSEDIDGSGNFTQLTSNDMVFAGYHTVVVRPFGENYYRFLAYMFDSPVYRTQVRNGVKGVKVFSVTQAILKNTNVWLPPFDEQKEIANELDQKTKNIDKLIAKQQEAILLMKERKTALISAAVTGKIDVRNYDVESLGCVNG
ncbi:MAG: restriction endonuclease subunit S [Psychrobium sp.]